MIDHENRRKGRQERQTEGKTEKRKDWAVGRQRIDCTCCTNVPIAVHTMGFD
jgi:hypothetical protein